MTTGNSLTNLPDHYLYVAHDVLEMCKPSHGVWADIGCGEGGLALALTKFSHSTVVLVDPSRKALAGAVEKSREHDVLPRAVAVCGQAESIPLGDVSVDLVVSRGSMFFWEDQPAGVREVYRILRPGGKAMLGGGLGNNYPVWARREFTRRRRENVRKRGQEAVRVFRELRSSQTFRHWADEAGLDDFRVVGEGGLPEDDPDAGIGIWLIFEKDTH